jgi:hypothetical protein
MSWATLDEVGDYPSPVEVTQEHLDLAQDMIEIAAGCTDSGATINLSDRNLRLLNRAVIYQSIFVANHPELLISHDVTSASADGVSAQYRTAEAQLYAPMASRCVRRLSWKQRGVKTRPMGAGPDVSLAASRDSAARDDARCWRPL